MHKDPLISFVIPVLNAEGLLPACLQSIFTQEYPRERMEILVLDGGSTDGTRDVARSFGATVIENPRKLAEPGVDMGLRHAQGALGVIMAADNGLPTPQWIRQMIRPFLERPQVMGAYTHIVESSGDNSFTRYYCRLHVEPFTWFVYGAACNPRYFNRIYPETVCTPDYQVFQFTPVTHPLLAMAQAFVVRLPFPRREGFEHDDILPVIQMIQDGHELAYVPGAGVYHHHLSGLMHFMKKYQWRIRNSLYENNVGFDNRAAYMTRARRIRKYLFEVYGLTGIGPLLDSMRLWFREKNPCMLWHAPACVVLSWVILAEYVGKYAKWARIQPVQGGNRDGM